jgi:hypothetical protein
MQPKSIVFRKGELFWDEASILVEGVLLGLRHFGGILTDPIRFGGNYCKRLTLANSSRWREHVRVRTAMEECRFEETTIPGPQHDLLFVKCLEQVILGQAYQTVLPHIEKRFGKECKNWPPLLDFCRHIRNGVCHGNRFDIRSPPWPDRTWRGLTLTKALHGKPVVDQQDGGFGVADVIALLFDLRKELERLGINPVQTPDCRT